MTFTDSVYAVDGARITGQLFRQQLRSSTRSGQGIILPTDLEVRELATPGSSIRSLDGDGVILGAEVGNQGSYFFTNNGEEELPIAATGAGETRSDLIIARAEDPTFSGSPWTHDPSTTRIVWPRVVADVAPGTTEAPAGDSAIALARIDIPASTATITQAMIVDLRDLLDPLTHFFQESKQHTGPDESTTSTTYVDFPSNSTFQVPVPDWATDADVNIMHITMRAIATGSSTNLFGNVRALVNGVDVAGFSEYNVDWNGGAVRFTSGAAGTFDPKPYQGQTVTLKTQMLIQGGTAGAELNADNGTNAICQVYFRQIPRSTV